MLYGNHDTLSFEDVKSNLLSKEKFDSRDGNSTRGFGSPADTRSYSTLPFWGQFVTIAVFVPKNPPPTPCSTGRSSATDAFIRIAVLFHPINQCFLEACFAMKVTGIMPERVKRTRFADLQNECDVVLPKTVDSRGYSSSKGSGEDGHRNTKRRHRSSSSGGFETSDDVSTPSPYIFSQPPFLLWERCPCEFVWYSADMKRGNLTWCSATIAFEACCVLSIMHHEKLEIDVVSLASMSLSRFEKPGGKDISIPSGKVLRLVHDSITQELGVPSTSRIAAKQLIQAIKSRPDDPEAVCFFIMVMMSKILLPTTDFYVPKSDVWVASDLEMVASIDWSMVVFQAIRDKVLYVDNLLPPQDIGMDLTFTPHIHMYTKDIVEQLLAADCESGGEGAPTFGNLPLLPIDTTCYAIKPSGSGAVPASELIRAPSYKFPNMSYIIGPHLETLPDMHRVGLLQSIQEYDKQAKECAVEIKQFMIVVDKHHLLCQRVIDAIQNCRSRQAQPGSPHSGGPCAPDEFTGTEILVVGHISPIEEHPEQEEVQQGGQEQQHQNKHYDQQQYGEEHEMHAQQVEGMFRSCCFKVEVWRSIYFAKIAVFVYNCETFLGIPPHFNLFRHLFAVKPQPNRSHPSVVGGTGILLREGSKKAWLSLPMKTSLKGWHAAWFYCSNLANSLLPYVGHAPVAQEAWSSLPTTEEMPQVNSLLNLIENLKTAGLTGIWVTRHFIRCRIQPLKDRVRTATSSCPTASRASPMLKRGSEASADEPAAKRMAFDPDTELAEAPEDNDAPTPTHSPSPPLQRHLRRPAFNTGPRVLSRKSSNIDPTAPTGFEDVQPPGPSAAIVPVALSAAPVPAADPVTGPATEASLTIVPGPGHHPGPDRRAGNCRSAPSHKLHEAECRGVRPIGHDNDLGGARAEGPRRPRRSGQGQPVRRLQGHRED
uniref:Transposase (putative) gypsy type domain-containing protein n=1 Tax=Oryza brachyantha TaxID=4533 RepID=J3LXN9_ORYBR